MSYAAVQEESLKLARHLKRSFGVSTMEAEDAVEAAWESVITRNELRFENFSILRGWVRKAAEYRLMNFKTHRRIAKEEQFDVRDADAVGIITTWNTASMAAMHTAFCVTI